MAIPAKVNANVRGRKVGLALRALREQKGYTADFVAEQLGCSQGKVSRIELAQSNVGKGDLFLLLDLYGVTELAERERMWELAREARRPGWWERVAPDERLATYVAFEHEAAEIAAWNANVVHGLLQIEQYARALFLVAPIDRSAEELERVIQVRMTRQRRIQDGSLKLWWILHESVLERPYGGPEVFAQQLSHLVAMRNKVTIQVLRKDTARHFNLGAYTIMQFAEAPTVTFLETVVGELPLDDPSHIPAYQENYNRLRAEALNPSESIEFIEQVRTRL
ncbi:helix-turn-helix domain-containing protein [Catellatospora methionotrophica]|uniref:helix-turn-helix domain-containing protein n=1 Tax=Catellatospora methionotrophica TaxID=121620 RepID=UPI00140B328C|nr:helix-turn-helix transcriptional regulator [Catellatospora methionotrophica]